MKNIFITGVSTGLGYALAQTYLERGDKVYAVGKEVPGTLDHHANFFFFPYDLSQTYTLKETLQEFIQKRSFDIAILNAGILGGIQPLSQTDLDDIRHVMDINVWANKEIVDALSQYAFVHQIVGISSGASLKGSKGWGTYALSKAGLNTLLKTYAEELPDIHFTALAPGVIDTVMIRHIFNTVDEKYYPSISKLKKGEIQSPREAAHRLIKAFPKLLEHESGSFIDIRTMA